MRQVNVYGPGDVRLDTVSPPDPGPRDIVVQVAACGICGSDLHIIRGGGRHRCPVPLGHEATGKVAYVGSAVSDVRVGQRVLINPLGDEGSGNIIGCGGSEGALTEEVLVRNAGFNRSVYEIPDHLSYDFASLAEPLGVAMHAVNRARPQPGERAVVCGAGPIGIGAVMFLKRAGVRDIVVSDLSPERLATAKFYGATETVLAGRDDMEKTLYAVHGETKTLLRPAPNTDIFIDAAGVASFVEDAVRISKMRARLVCFGVHFTPVKLDLQAMLTTEFTITTSVGYPTELPDVLTALGEMSPEELAPLISQRFSFDNALDAFKAAGKQSATKILIEFPM